MNDLAQFMPPQQREACEPNEDFWGFRLTGAPGEGQRIVDLVPLTASFLGALPGLIYRERTPDGAGTVFAVIGGIIGLCVGSVAWVILPPHGRCPGFLNFSNCSRYPAKEAACSGGIFG